MYTHYNEPRPKLRFLLMDILRLFEALFSTE